MEEEEKSISEMTNYWRRQIKNGRKIRNMCDVAERLENIGFRKGEISTVIKLVASGKLEFEEGANLLNMSVAALMQKLREAGYSEEDFQHGN